MSGAGPTAAPGTGPLRPDLLPPSVLDGWYRRYYGATPLDVSSSGVHPYTLRELREVTGTPVGELDRVLLGDSDTMGLPSLRAAVADRLGTDADHVMVTHGSSEAIFLACCALLRPGDDVVVTEAVYHSHRSLPAVMGCTVRTWRLVDGDGFAPDLAALEHLVRPGTRAVLVNFPHNPTGVALDTAEIDRLVDLVTGRGAFLLWDGAFEDLHWDAAPTRAPRAGLDRVVRTGTLSKAFGLPGLRVGWLVAPPAVLERCVGPRDAATLLLSPLVETLAERALRDADALIAPRRRVARRNLAVLDEWSRQRPELVDWQAPQGGVCGFPALRGVPDTEAACRWLAEHEDVLLVPGASFGHPERVRIGFGGPADEFDEALSRIDRVLRSRSWRRRQATAPRGRG